MKNGAYGWHTHSVLSDINNNAKGKYGWHFDVIQTPKYAKITFESKDDAFWFRLRNKIT